MRDDENLNHVILESIETARRDNKTYESQNPLERRRKNGVPVGLKNIGNSIKILKILKNSLKKKFSLLFQFFATNLFYES